MGILISKSRSREVEVVEVVEAGEGDEKEGEKGEAKIRVR